MPEPLKYRHLYPPDIFWEETFPFQKNWDSFLTKRPQNKKKQYTQVVHFSTLNNRISDVNESLLA